jgi:hypothetical protein
VNDFAAVQVGEAVKDAFSDLAEDLLASTAATLADLAVDGVEAAALAQLHGDGDGAGGLVHEGAVIAADMFGGAVLVEVDLTDDLLLDVRIGVGGDDFKGEDGLAVLEAASCDGTASALAQTAELDDHLLFAGGQPALVVKVLDIQRAAALEAEALQVGQNETHAVPAAFAFHADSGGGGSGIAIRVDGADGGRRIRVRAARGTTGGRWSQADGTGQIGIGG